MSLSLSLCLCVCSHFVMFGVFKSFEMRCFKGVIRVSPGCLNDVLRVSQVCLKEILRFFEGFQRYFKSV